MTQLILLCIVPTQESQTLQDGSRATCNRNTSPTVNYGKRPGMTSPVQLNRTWRLTVVTTTLLYHVKPVSTGDSHLTAKFRCPAKCPTHSLLEFRTSPLPCLPGRRRRTVTHVGPSYLKRLFTVHPDCNSTAFQVHRIMNQFFTLCEKTDTVSQSSYQACDLPEPPSVLEFSVKYRCISSCLQFRITLNDAGIH